MSIGYFLLVWIIGMVLLGVMDAVRKLILEKMHEKRLTMSGVSKMLGMNHAYMQQFLKRGVPEELDEKERRKLSEILELPEDELRGPSDALPKREYVKSNQSVANPSLPTIKSSSGHNLIDTIRPAAQLYVDRDLPVFGTAQGGHGELIVTARAIDWMARPASLLRVEEAYGMIVTGDLMSPKIENGDIVQVNPHLPPRNGATCIFRRKMEDGTEHAIVRYLRRFNDDTWFVRQFNPPRDFTLKRVEWPVCHVATDLHFAL